MIDHQSTNDAESGGGNGGPCGFCYAVLRGGEVVGCRSGQFDPDGKPVCSIEEVQPFVATHCLPGIAIGYWKLYCDDCFVDIYGPHVCERLGCKPGCKDAGKTVTEEE